MFDALDSAVPPSDVQVQQAKAAGYGGWWGYIATSGQGGSAFNLLHIWTLADFSRVRALNPRPLAFCSGLDDPTGLRTLAAQWNVRLCLDDEQAIRPTGGWEQGFLDASGAGLYGNCGLHAGISAPFHVVAAYPTSGNPAGVSWWPQCPNPGGPTGWQWVSHQEFGLDVDRGTYDDSFRASFPSRGDGSMLVTHPNHPGRLDYVRVITGQLVRHFNDTDWLSAPGGLAGAVAAGRGWAYGTPSPSVTFAPLTAAASWVLPPGDSDGWLIMTAVDTTGQTWGIQHQWPMDGSSGLGAWVQLDLTADLSQAGPAGPPGPPGPASPPHTHSVSLSGNTGQAP